MTRYHRQEILGRIGAAGQERLGRSRVLIVGCGALGSVVAELLARAGVGFLRIADRDLVEMSNLQRQVLFDERDVAEEKPKAVAAAGRLGEINGEIRVEAVVADVNGGNVEALCEVKAVGGRPPPPPSPGDLRSAVPGEGERDGVPGEGEKGGVRGELERSVDLIVDGTDNVATRYLINDVAVKRGIPWVYGGCVGVEGRVWGIWPGRTGCLRCVFPEPPNASEMATCDTAGVLGSAAAVVGGLQAAVAIRFLVEGEVAAANSRLVTVNVWDGEFRSMGSVAARSEDCPCCGMRRFEFLSTNHRDFTTNLCGRGAVQVLRGNGGAKIDLPATALRWEKVGEVGQTPWFVRCKLGDPAGINLTLFADGRLIVQGTTEPMRAASIYARFVGS